MSAGTLGVEGFAQDSAAQSHPRMRAGYTSISAGTMNRLVAAIAADVFNVPLTEVRAGVHDQSGQVSVSLAVPLALHPAAEVFGGTVFERAASGRQRVANSIEELAGSTVSRVDVRLTGIHESDPRNAGRVQ